MADIEERPTKIRKLGSSADSNGLSGEARSTMAEFSTPTNDPSNAGSPEEASEQLSQSPQANLSKSQLKKLRKSEKWQAGKEYRKSKRREKHKEKQARKASERAELKAKIDAGEIVPPSTTAAPEAKTRFKRPVQVPVSLILDCDFNELMTEKELISLGAQLTRCYSENRSAGYRTHYAVSSWGGDLKKRFETVLTNNHMSWKGVKFFEGDFEAAALDLDGVMRGKEGGKVAGAIASAKTSEEENEQNKVGEATIEEGKNETTVEGEKSSEKNGVPSTSEPTTDPKPPEATNDETNNLEQEAPGPSIVYLTSDSPHTLTTLLPNTSYIIGGIVDKNRHKGICYKRACERGIPTAKLPIGEYMTMQSRSVLAINHVVEIMLRWLETGDWGEAFLKVIPKRKEARLKGRGDGSKDGGNGEGERQEDDGDGESENEEEV
jgi:tRNA (guanine9-N1)-methyltransferase